MMMISRAALTASVYAIRNLAINSNNICLFVNFLVLQCPLPLEIHTWYFSHIYNLKSCTKRGIICVLNKWAYNYIIIFRQKWPIEVYRSIEEGFRISNDYKDIQTTILKEVLRWVHWIYFNQYDIRNWFIN